MTVSTRIRAAVITVSDSAALARRTDESGPAARDVLEAAGFTVLGPVVVPDEAERIESTVIDEIRAGARVVVLTGGTGIGPRDVTPEAIEPLLVQRLPGLEEELRRLGVAAGAPGSLLSRPAAGVARIVDAEPALVLAGPGSRGGARDAATLAAQFAEHAVGLLDGETEHGQTDHGQTEHGQGEAP